MFQIGSPPNPTPATARSPVPLSSPASPISSISSGSPPRERRLSFSSDFDRNKFVPNPAMNSSPLDGFFGLSTPLSPNLVPPPHLTTPPLNSPKPAPLPSATPLAPTRPPSRPPSPTLQQLSPSTPTPISRMTGRSSFEFGRISIEDLNALSSGLGAATPLTPKPSPMDFNPLASRAPAQQPSLNVPFPSSSSMPKSPPQITPTGGHPPSTASVLIPNRPTPNFISNQVVPSPSKQYSLTPASSSPSRIASAYTTLSPPLSRHSPARNASPFDENQGIQRRFSEPPPVDANLLFPELARIKDNNKKADVLEPAKKYMYSAMLHLEKNSIPAALGNLDLCISVLATLPIEAAAELEYSAKYRLFLILLKEIAKPRPPIEHAFLSFFLSDISVKPPHRVIAIRMAIRHNMNSGNYGIAAALIQLLVDRIHPVDENVLLEKLRKCMGAGKTNSDKRFKTYMCPACDKTNNVNSTKCSLCLQPIRFCALTLEIIATKAYYSCKLCKLNFSRKAISPRDSDLKCPFCKVGDLTNKVFAVNK